MNESEVVSRSAWLAARKQLLATEERVARLLAEAGAQRRALPMVRIDKTYVFEGQEGKVDLFDLFAGRSQLIVYHFMFDPAWNEGCRFCSYLVDNIGNLSHLHARDTELALVSRAPLAKLESFRARMGWTVPWYSSAGSDFNYDFHVTLDEAIAPVEYTFQDKASLARAGEVWLTTGEQNGVSVFVQRDGTVHHTYSAYVEGAELLNGTDNYLDLTPQGRPMLAEVGGWLRLHDRY